MGGLTGRHGVCSVADERQATSAVVPGLRDPVADVGFVDGRVVGDPGEGGVGGLGEGLGAFFDQREAVGVRQGVVGVAEPGHGEVEDPGLRVVGAVGHARDWERRGQVCGTRRDLGWRYLLDWKAWKERWLSAR